MSALRPSPLDSVSIKRGKCESAPPPVRTST
jgi:hypothetical protein